MKFIVPFVFKPDNDPKVIAALVPGEQARVGELMQQGLIENMFLASDYKRGWMVLNVSNRLQAVEVLKSLPLYPYMGVELMELAQ